MAKEIYKNEGLYGFYKGYSVSFYASIIYGIVYFTLYKQCKNILEPRFEPYSPFLYASASMIANLVSLAVYYPFVLVKTRWLSSNDVFKYTSLSGAFKELFSSGSLSNVYKGTSAYFFTYVFGYSIQMTTYELCVKFLKTRFPKFADHT